MYQIINLNVSNNSQRNTFEICNKCIYDGLRRTPGLSRKFAVTVDALKHIGYCVNKYNTPVRK